MLKKLLVIFSLLTICINVQAQEYVLWSDDFEDDDSLATRNVGWLYLPEDLGIKDVLIYQKAGELFMRQGYYELFPGLGIGVGIIETNGTPAVLWDNPDSTKKLILKNDYTYPNQVLSFNIRFDRWRNLGETSSFFSVHSRLKLTDAQDSIPLSDATKEPCYVLAFWPIQGKIVCAKYDSTEFAAIFPDRMWNKFAEVKYKFELDVNYRAKFYLNEGDVKVKVWEGAPEDEPATWLIEANDPEPYVKGTFTAFAIIGPQPEPGMGEQIYLDDIKMEGWQPTNVENQHLSRPPQAFQLGQNYPNPFNPNTRINFTLAEKKLVKLTIYNINGQFVRNLINSELPAGSHTISWDGRDLRNQTVPGGIYFYQLNDGNRTESRRMIFLK